MRRVFRLASIILGVAVLLASVVPWAVGWVIIVVSSGGEYHGIHQNDRPKSYHLLKFESWHQGDDGLQPSHILGLPDNYRIKEHRTGRAYGLITQMVYYEAQYQTPDGELRVTHATGVEPLISHRNEALAAGFVLCPIAATILFIVASRLKPVSTAPSTEDSVTKRLRTSANTQNAS